MLPSWYNAVMTVPTGVVQPREVVPGQVVVDDHVAAAVTIDPMSAAVHGVVRVLGELVHRSGSFHSEKEIEDAMNTLRTWEKRQVAQSTLNALLELSPHRAQVEDVTQRVPPNMGLAVAQALPAAFDYNKLARAILAIQAGSEPQDA